MITIKVLREVSLFLINFEISYIDYVNQNVEKVYKFDQLSIRVAVVSLQSLTRNKCKN